MPQSTNVIEPLERNPWVNRGNGIPMIVRKIFLDETSKEGVLTIFLDNCPVDVSGNERKHEWHRFFMYIDRALTQDEVEYLLFKHFIVEW